MSEFFEIGMLILFGLSWPPAVLKSYKARTAKGKSLSFLVLVIIGYICGIAAKLTAETFAWYVMFFYILDLVMVLADFGLYFRNLKLDRQRDIS